MDDFQFIKKQYQKYGEALYEDSLEHEQKQQLG